MSRVTLQGRSSTFYGYAMPACPVCIRGTSYIADNWLRYKFWHPLLKRAQVRRLDLHAARHTFASRLIGNNENLKYVSEQLGHSSIQVTADIYGHLIPGGNRQAVDRLDQVEIENCIGTVTETVTETKLNP